MKSTFLTLAAVAAIFFATACTKQETAESPKFDPKAIAAEVDKGNLAPLVELNKACTAEVEKNGRRMAACGVQDEVGKLAKPLSVRF
jgi:hypothetical protein